MKTAYNRASGSLKTSPLFFFIPFFISGSAVILFVFLVIASGAIWRETTEATLKAAVFIWPQDANSARLLILQADCLSFHASITPDKITLAENVVHSSIISPQTGSKGLQKAVFLAAASCTHLS